MEQSHKTRRTIRRVLFILACAVICLFPSFGPPSFRYTGADLSVYVWNLGWPLPLMIYDARPGIHLSPPSLIIIGIPAVLIAILAYRKHPTALMVIAQLGLLTLVYLRADMLYWRIIRCTPEGGKPPAALLYRDICNIAWQFWFLTIPVIVSLLIWCARAHRNLIRTNKKRSAKVLKYGTIAALTAALFLLREMVARY
jgi:hypothetical protein